MKTPVSERRFHANLEKWSHFDPQNAIRLGYLTPKRWELVTEPQLNLRSEQGLFHEMTQEWLKTIDLKETEVLYIYGLGVGHAFEHFRPWLNANRKRHLVFLEDDPEVLFHLFSLDNGSEILKHQRVDLYYFDGLDDPCFERLVWQFVRKKMQVAIAPFYAKTKTIFSNELHHKLFFDQKTKLLGLMEYLGGGKDFFDNFYRNVQMMPEAKSGDALFDQFKNVPAIICGAGPSLNKHLPHLAELANHALIFAGGSSLNALVNRGIQPHFGAGIDPYPAQLERLKENQKYPIPFFYRNRMHHEALKMVRGPKLFLTGAGGYDVATWIENKLHIDGIDLDEGHNVVNFTLSIAQAMGCNPIILVGMDLAYTDDKIYAEGIISDVSRTSHETKEDQFFALTLPDINGKSVHTQWKWLAESRWISTFAKNHPEITLINATEGGIGFDDVPNLSLKETTGVHLNKTHPLEQQLSQLIQNADLTPVSTKKIVQHLHSLEESLLRCIDLITTLLAETKAAIKNKELTPTPRALLAEHDLADEEAFIFVLDMFNLVYNHMLTGKIEKIKRAELKGPTPNTNRQKLLLQEEKYAFLLNLAKTNLTQLKSALQ